MPEQQVTPKDTGIVPPPLFSPHVYVLDKQERRTFESGYTTEFSRFMVSDYDELFPILLLAKRYNIRVTWKRVLEVAVHEAWALKPQLGFSIHDVRCKVDVAGQTGRTELVNPNLEQKVVWNQSFKFHVGDPSDIVLLLYCRNMILPNDKLGRIWITPSQLIEGKTSTEWFSLNTFGEVKLSITLSPPELTPFKFSFPSYLSVSSHDNHIFNADNEEVMTMVGKWPHSVSFLDARSNSVLTFKNCVNEPHEREFTLYLYGHCSHTLTVTQICLEYGDSEFQIEGLPKIAVVKTTLRNFTYLSPTNTCVASAKLMGEKYFVEIQPGEDAIIILATMALIAKLLYIEGKAIKEWSSLKSSGNHFQRTCVDNKDEEEEQEMEYRGRW